MGVQVDDHTSGGSTTFNLQEEEEEEEDGGMEEGAGKDDDGRAGAGVVGTEVGGKEGGRGRECVREFHPTWG